MQPDANPLSERYRAYRRRLVAKGRHQLIVDLPRETVAFIDELKERHGLRNRSQVLMQLIEKGREAAQHMRTPADDATTNGSTT
jgi:metal-responsive CopG/Arc/MetJ family transcriptional regulator